ncbi:MAG: hypothetical protein ACHQ4J_13770 [Candidatus Binatia bacterium]
MAVIIPFQDIVRARRREAERACAERCVEIIELNLRLALERFDVAPAAERPLYARRVRQLGLLLEYAVNVQ